ncbi:hypothetical protein ACIQZB_28395 [Streptomyces sp. NPDC097727]|uniref:hypothetical protein n=1 Tax=Streptomyces sp. NPDC097727 TaxID=3366092 RepID=UPI003823BA1A
MNGEGAVRARPEDIERLRSVRKGQRSALATLAKQQKKEAVAALMTLFENPHPLLGGGTDLLAEIPHPPVAVTHTPLMRS